MEREAEGRTEKSAAMPEGTGRNPEGIGCGASGIATTKGIFSQERRDLMEAVVERENMERALRRVMSNKGAPGVDGLRAEDLRGYCIRHWPVIKEALLTGEYKPQPVLGVEIPKPGGGVRQLGIPTAFDRLIQQAVHQVLSPLFEPGFSESSYGFRPGRSAHYVKTRRSGERVMASIRRYLAERLKLRVNESKSGVHRPWERKFLSTQ